MRVLHFFSLLSFFLLLSLAGYSKTSEFIIIVDNSSPLSSKIKSVVQSFSKHSSSQEIDFYLLPYSMHQTAPRIDTKFFEKLSSQSLERQLRSYELSSQKLSLKDGLQTASLFSQWKIQQGSLAKPFFIFVGDTDVALEKTGSGYQVDSRTQGLLNNFYRGLEKFESEGFHPVSIFLETEGSGGLVPLNQSSFYAALDQGKEDQIFNILWNENIADEIVLYATDQNFEQIRQREIAEKRKTAIREGQRDALLRKPREIVGSESQIKARTVNLEEASDFLPRSIQSSSAFPFRYIVYPEKKASKRNILEVSRDQFVLDFEAIQLLPNDLLLKLSRGRDLKSLSKDLERDRAHRDKSYWTQFFAAMDPEVQVEVVELNQGESFKISIFFSKEFSAEKIQGEVERLTLNGRLYDFDSLYQKISELSVSSQVSKQAVPAMRVKDWEENLGIRQRPRNFQDLEVDYVASSGNSFYFGLGKKYLELKIKYREPLLDPLLAKKLGKTWLKSRVDGEWKDIERAFEEARINDDSRGVAFFYSILEGAGFRPIETKIDIDMREIRFRFDASASLDGLQRVLSQYSLANSLRDLQAVFMLSEQWKNSKSETERNKIFKELQSRFSIRSAVEY